jgi:hypothetical protein
LFQIKVKMLRIIWLLLYLLSGLKNGHSFFQSQSELDLHASFEKLPLRQPAKRERDCRAGPTWQAVAHGFAKGSSDAWRAGPIDKPLHCSL